MNKQICTLLSAAAAITITTAAGASPIMNTIGAPIIVPDNDVQVRVTFLGSDAGLTGELYFLGSGADALSLDAVQADTTDAGLGMFLFNNHPAAAHAMIMLPGTFQQGDVLHFAYDIITGKNGGNNNGNAHSNANSNASNNSSNNSRHNRGNDSNLYRTDSAADQAQFLWHAGNGYLGVEDIRLPWGDHDYNDAEFQITFISVVPAPGPFAALIFLVLAPARRRRA